MIERIGRDLNLPLTQIGRITAGSGLRVVDENGRDITPNHRGFDHFHEN
jgi:thiamine-monophosphate kinase